MDAIKTGLSVGAGTGGGFALLIALRRQWLSERQQAHREAVDQQEQVHSDRVAAATEHDAAERRVTDLYLKAADLLGADRAPVRLAGLYALERLAQNNPVHRQTVVNVFCAYLRMPYTPPAESSDSDDDGDQAQRREELQVRLTAQRILAEHLRDEAYQGQRAEGSIPETFWPDIRIDLTGAHLIDFFLGYCRVETVGFHDAAFTGEAVFRGLHCDLAFFQNATFSGHTDFRGAVFTNSAWFSYSTFGADVWFHADEFCPGARFGRHASFKHVTFAKGARFDQATFAGSAEFDEARYGNGAKTINLEGARVEDPRAVSPEVSKAPSSWPPGWIIQPGSDDPGILTWAS
jgi:hypothetical protein